MILPTLPRVVVPFLIALLAAPEAHAKLSAADQAALAEAFALFSKGAYPQALDRSEKVKGSDAETQSAVHFFRGTVHSKLQKFDEASGEYAKALASGSKEKSIHYDYGQALFATQKLKEAEEEFRASIRAGFKLGASAYYIAYIRTVLDDKPKAREFYRKIEKLSRDDDKVKQSALFQLAELSYDDANDMRDVPEKKAQRKALLEGEVLSLYRKARDFDSGAPLAEQAQARIDEVERQLEQLVERMRNGNPLPRHRHTLLLSQDLTYDSNVITQADQALVQVSNKDALIWKTGFVAKYQFAWQRTVSFIPELSSSISYHSQRGNPGIYQNDNASFTPALRTKLEHWSGSNPATLQLDMEFNLMLRDYQKQHRLPFYSRYYLLALSERVKWFAIGSSTLKLSIKAYESYNPAKNSYSPAASITQIVSVGKGLSLVNTLTFDYLHARDDVNDERNYKYRISTSFSQLIEKIDLSVAIATALKDTMKQKGSRGNEFNLAPNIGLSRPFGKKIDATLEYTWTKNFSMSKNTYQYTKGELHFGLGFNF